VYKKFPFEEVQSSLHYRLTSGVWTVLEEGDTICRTTMGVSTLHLLVALAILGRMVSAAALTLSVTGGCMPVTNPANLHTFKCLPTNQVTLTCSDVGGSDYKIVKDDVDTGITLTTRTATVQYDNANLGKGEYKCQATVGSSTVTSDDAQILVDANPTLSVSGCTAKAGAPGTFLCASTADVNLKCKGNPDATEYEFKEGVTSKRQRESTPTFQITFSDSTGWNGAYTCQAYDGDSTADPTGKTSNTITLNDDSSLSVSGCNGADTNDVNTFNCKPEDDITLTCGKVTGANDFKILKNGVDEVVTATTQADATKTLKYKDATLGKGDYTCKATVSATDKRVSSPVKRLIDDPPRSGSTNVQMSYLMIGLVTLMSAVWSGRVW